MKDMFLNSNESVDGPKKNLMNENCNNILKKNQIASTS
jgi:hypothetical protein